MEKFIKVFGQPIRQEELDGEGGRYINMYYPSFEAVIYKENGSYSCDALTFWGDDFRIMSAVVPSGIKIGDDIALYEYVDFPYLFTGRHFDGKGLRPNKDPWESVRGNVYNYQISLEEAFFNIYFAVEDGIIKEIMVAGYDDIEYSGPIILDPVTGFLSNEIMEKINEDRKNYFSLYEEEIL